jgi:hypothetical protein
MDSFTRIHAIRDIAAQANFTRRAIKAVMCLWIHKQLRSDALPKGDAWLWGRPIILASDKEGEWHAGLVIAR